MINNHYLFSSQFRSYLHAQELDDLAFFEGFVATVSSFLHAAATADLDALTQRVIAPILTQLQFANPPLEAAPAAPAARYAYLYDGFPLTKQVSCVYVTLTPALSQRARESLDVAEKGNFPAFDLIQLLRQANLEWGMLTNGMVWRLYSTRAAQPYEQYLEIDFSDAQPEDFKIFWQLFSLTLFLPDEQEVTPLETYIAESQQEATVIEKHIKSKIEALLENICVGLLAYAGKDQQPLTEAEQQSYFENAVYLLFRLLFVLYAESRELLPVHDPAYQAISLQALIRRAHDWKQAGLVNAAGVELWDGFRDLCDKIQFGDPQLNIPEYDGGLFDSREHPFLADPRNKVSNLYFVNVLDLLGYRTVRKEVQPINYRDLSVRSLGSLYEGILEYKLFLATEELVLRGQTLIPRKDAGKVKKTERVIAAGQVYFAQAANERHDTGSYYTPEEVVNYMVQHSVRVGLEERWSAFQPTVERYEQEVRQAVSEDLRRALRRKFDQEVLDFVETQVLSFKVLDPAMGSGHFLVNALHAITHFILEVLQGGGDAAAASLLTHHNSAIDLTPALWRRKVVERCIFGVDLNPLAAELAKLSLWIASAAAGKPLTFLNHHLKCGDSLIGAQLKEIGRYPLLKKKAKDEGQLGLLERDQGFLTTVQDVLQRLESIVARDSENIEQIGAKKQWLKEAQLALQPYKALCDFHTSLFFGNELSHDAYDNILLAFTPEFSWNGETFFHWELEFPDVMLKGKGFDVVIGNPPYISIAKLPKETNELLSKQHYETYSKNADIYCLFFEKGVNLTKKKGILSYISSNRFCFTNYGIGLRKYLSRKNILQLINFNEINIFESANVGSLVTFVENDKPADNNIFVNEIRGELNLGIVSSLGRRIERSYYQENQWSFDENKSQNLKQKIESKGVPFIKLKGVSINRGITTGLNNVFIISDQKRIELINEHSSSKEIICPVLKGANIKRYHIIEPKQFLIYAYTGIEIEKYPAVYNYLKKYQDELEKVYEAKHGQKKWFELRKCSYYDKFSVKKLVWTRLSNINAFAISNNGEFTIDSSSFAVSDDMSIEYLAAILNSKIVFFYFKLGSVIWGKDGIKWFGKYFDNIPIPEISKKEQQSFVALVDHILAAKQQHPNADTRALEADIDRMVYALYGLSEAEIALVEGQGN